MTTYETKHAIGDLVYVANEYEVDREVIKAVKIEGTKETIKYGIKRPKRSDWFFYNNDDYNWYTTGEIFEKKESAVAHRENLKAIKEAKELKEELAQKAERKAALLEEIKELDNE